MIYKELQTCVDTRFWTKLLREDASVGKLGVKSLQRLSLWSWHGRWGEEKGRWTTCLKLDVKPTFYNKQNLVLIQYWYNMMNENKCKPFSHVFFCLQVALPIVSCFWSPPSIPRCPKYVHHLGLRSGKLSASAMSMPMCGFSVDSTLEMHRNA